MNACSRLGGFLFPLLVLLVQPVQAAIGGPGVAQSALSITNAAATTAFGSAGGATGVSLTGSWGGTITFECTIDGSTWFVSNAAVPTTGVLVTTTTANGQWILSSAGFQQCRARLNPAISGTVTATLVSVQASPSSLAGTSGTTITGTVLQGTSPWNISGNTYVQGTATITGTTQIGNQPTITGTVQVGNAPTVQPGNTQNTTPWLITGTVQAGTGNATVQDRQATTGGLCADVTITTGAYQMLTANTTRVSAVFTNNDITSGVRVGLGSTPTSTAGFLLRPGVSFTTTGTFAISFIRDTGATNNVTVSCSTELQ